MHTHQLIYGLDLIGTAVFAISGALAAGRKRMDVFGVLVLAMVTALGGGTLRDTLLDSGPVFWIHQQGYLLVCVIGAITALLMVRQLAVPRRTLVLFDALGLAVFTVVGTAKALELTGLPMIAVIMGVMTGVAGGMIRDVLSAEVPLILHKEIYATAALLGGCVYVLLARYELPSVVLLSASILTTLGIRLAAIYWGFSLPVFEHEDGNSA